MKVAIAPDGHKEEILITKLNIIVLKLISSREKHLKRNHRNEK